MSSSLKPRLAGMMSRSELNCHQNRNDLIGEGDSNVGKSKVGGICVGGMDQLYVIIDGSDSVLIDTKLNWNHFIDISKDLGPF